MSTENENTFETPILETKNPREKQILQFLQDKGRYCPAEELVEAFKVSPVTIHRDLTSLATQGLVRKLRGGAELTPGASAEGSPSHFRARTERMRDEKSEIAEKALALVREGDFVFLDSSTTAYALARRLRQRSFGDLTLLTNSVLILEEFHLFPAHLQLIAVGGRYHPQLHALLGRAAQETVRALRPRRCFFSAAAISLEHGIQSFHEDHAAFLSILLERSEEKILLADHSKFDQEALHTIAPLATVDLLVSDRGLGDAQRRAYGAHVRTIL